MNHIIIKKRDGGKLSEEEIKFFIEGFSNDDIPDYQAAALLMAIFLRQMDEEETVQLTEAMRYSGDTIDLSEINGIKVDKHSTGGVGDKVTLVVGPIAASCGVPIAKMSGRGLGFTGGTVDKMESIPGFNVTLEPDEFIKQVNEIGLAVVGQSGHLTPADKKIYALRDVTGTVDNLSLISSSIMSKKLAAGSDKILLDVKCGEGAFMENEESAVELATMMCKIGKAAGKDTIAAITDMSQPLGRAVGNATEVIEAIETLKGNGPEDITLLAEELAGIMIFLGGRAKTRQEGVLLAKQAIASGAALNKMRAFIERQGGNPEIVDDYSLLPTAKHEMNLLAEEDGYISKINARIIGLASQRTGAGRAKKDDDLDYTAGIFVEKKVGDKVSAGDVLLTIYGNDKAKLEIAHKEAKEAFVISYQKPEIPKLLKQIVEI
ncbi:pyrimidine-nucleoside phosphorylase [Eubacteriales bacterium KG127]